jgi:hypothetical protein
VIVLLLVIWFDASSLTLVMGFRLLASWDLRPVGGATSWRATCIWGLANDLGYSLSVSHRVQFTDPHGVQRSALDAMAGACERSLTRIGIHCLRWITRLYLPDCLRRDANRDVARASSSIGRAADF